MQCLFRPFVCFKVQYFIGIMLRGYIVAMWQCNHCAISTHTQILFPKFLGENQNLEWPSGLIHVTEQMQHMP